MKPKLDYVRRLLRRAAALGTRGMVRDAGLGALAGWLLKGDMRGYEAALLAAVIAVALDFTLRVLFVAPWELYSELQAKVENATTELRRWSDDLRRQASRLASNVDSLASTFEAYEAHLPGYRTAPKAQAAYEFEREKVWAAKVAAGEILGDYAAAAAGSKDGFHAEMRAKISSAIHVRDAAALREAVGRLNSWLDRPGGEAC